MAMNTTNTKLLYSTDGGTTYVGLVDIIDYPDMGTSPNKLDTTTLSTLKQKTFILGLQEAPDLQFMANYDKAKYTTLKGLEDTSHYYQLQFGEDGVDGIFEWQGGIVTTVTGKGIDEVRQMQITLSAETEITFS